MISVIVPTVAGREASLQRCLAAYRERTDAQLQVIVLHDRPTCGLAWNQGAARARGAYLCFTADDLEPLVGWDQAAREAADAGYMPAPLILQPSGAVESCGGLWGPRGQAVVDWQTVPMTGVPFLTGAQWRRVGPSLDCHYYTDTYLSERAHRAGIETVARTDYRLVHHWAQAGRGAGMTQDERMRHDQAIYERALREA